jgi:hypothetical protein
MLVDVYGDVIVDRDVTEHALCAGDVAMVMEREVMLPTACAVDLLRRYV